MKILSLLVLVSFGAFANADISKYQGHIYKKAEYDLCLKDYDVITKNVDSVEGFTVLSGGCLNYGRDNFRVEFDYIHPLASEVENYPITLTDEAACLGSIKKAQDEMLASGNHFVTAYCEGKVLNTQFVDTTRSIVRSLNKLGNFNSQPACLNFIADLTAKARADKMTSFMSYCQKYEFSGKTYFAPVFNYISFYEIEMNVINGKTVASSSACLNDRVSVEQNFSSNDIKVVYAFCSGTMTAENTQETILYLKPKNGRYITVYEGVVLNSQEVCETQLNSIMSGLEHSGESVLYGHCRKLNATSFVPSITYLKTIKF